MLGFEVLQGHDGVFHLVGELDMGTAGALLEATVGASDRPGEIVLDLTRLRFMDSSGAKAVFTLAQQVDGIVLRCPQPNVRRVLEVLGVERGVGIRIED